MLVKDNDKLPSVNTLINKDVQSLIEHADACVCDFQRWTMVRQLLTPASMPPGDWKRVVALLRFVWADWGVCNYGPPQGMSIGHGMPMFIPRTCCRLFAQSICGLEFIA